MDEFYGLEKHESPTKRLIDQKNTCADHKDYINKKLTKEYGIHYTSSPGVSYVIEPINGEINYKSARLNPLKFYDEIIKQEVLQHKVLNINGQ